MRVLFLSSDIASVGGIQKYSSQFIDALVRAGHDVETLDKTARDAKVRFGVRVFVAAFRQKPDLVICGHVHLAPVALIVRRLLGTPYAVVTYGIESWNLSSRPFLHSSLRSAVVVATISRFTRDRLLAQLPEIASRLYLLVNPVDGSEFRPERRDAGLLARYGIAPTDPVILTVGRLSSAEQYKGYDTVIHALPEILRAIPNVKYLIVGQGDDRARIESLIAKLGLSRQVILAGYVTDQELVGHYNLCDAFVMPSTGEGFGIVFLEALACGKPVVAGNEDASREAVLDGTLGFLVNPRDVREVAAVAQAALSRSHKDARTDPEWLRTECLSAYGMDRFRASIEELLDRATTHPLRVAYVGGYDPLYTRVRTTLKGLRRNQVTVYECRSGAGSRIVRLAGIALRYLAVMRRVRAIVVSEAGQSYMLLARILAWVTRKPVIFDAFTSYYHVNVVNAKLYAPDSIVGRYFFNLDKTSCQLADRVVLDTEAHASYFERTFGTPPEKLAVVPVGSDDEWFMPSRGIQTDSFPISFVASFYPLHGVEYVIRAMKLLETDPRFQLTIIGNGLQRRAAKELAAVLELTNVRFVDFVAPYALPGMLRDAAVCLGQFGNTEQNSLVVPAKVYDAIAMQKPVVTARARALEAVFTHRTDIYFCEPANPASIADAITTLAKDRALRDSIASAGHALFLKQFSLAKIGERFRDIIRTTIHD